jgi:hypothetical protein
MDDGTGNEGFDWRCFGCGQGFFAGATCTIVDGECYCDSCVDGQTASEMTKLPGRQPSAVAIYEARSHLGAALMQVLPSDEPNIIRHMRAAHALLGGKPRYDIKRGPQTEAEFVAEVRAIPSGWMGNVNGPGCDPDVGPDDPNANTPSPEVPKARASQVHGPDRASAPTVY